MNARQGIESTIRDRVRPKRTRTLGGNCPPEMAHWSRRARRQAYLMARRQRPKEER